MNLYPLGALLIFLLVTGCSGKPSSPELIAAINRSDYVEAEKFLIRGDNPNSFASGSDQPALLIAITRMDVRMVNLLLKHKAKTEAISANGFSPLVWVASSGSGTARKILIIRSLVEAGADLNKKSFFGNTPLHNLVNGNSDNIPVIEEAIRLGADPMIKNDKGATAIDSAIEKNIPLATIEYMKNAFRNKGSSMQKFGNTEGMCKVLGVGQDSNFDGLEGFFFDLEKNCDENNLAVGVSGTFTRYDGRECSGTWVKGVLKNPVCNEHM